jgi:hypothetical protein
MSQGEKKGSFTNIRHWIGKHKILSVILVFVAFSVIGAMSPSKPDTTPPPAQTPQAPQAPAMSVSEATSEFKDIMATSEKAQLVDSYTFSDTERVVYVTDLWYTQPVSFKKDFIAKIAMLQDTISGKHFFEVRDYQSNEKVAEVTAFSGSLEVYK